MINLASDDEDEVKVMPGTQPNSPQDSIKQTDSKVEHRQKSNKRPRPTKEATANHLQSDSQSDSRQDSAGKPDDEVEYRRKPNKRPQPTKDATATHVQLNSPKVRAKLVMTDPKADGSQIHAPNLQRASSKITSISKLRG